MTRNLKIVVGMVSIVAVALVAWPVYAHCGRCAASGKQMVTSMDQAKISLSKAIETAEAHCKGKAVAAHCELEGGNLEFEVYCIVGDEILEVEIDAQTGKVTEVEEHKLLPGFEEEHGEAEAGEHHEHGDPKGASRPDAGAARLVQAGCATCIFGMTGVQGCKLAVKIDGKPYLVSGSDVNAHQAGLCEAAKSAEVRGRIEGDTFVASAFELKE